MYINHGQPVLCPKDKPPRIIRYVDDLPTDKALVGNKLWRLDVANNVLFVNKNYPEMSDPRVRRYIVFAEPEWLIERLE